MNITDIPVKYIGPDQTLMEDYYVDVLPIYEIYDNAKSKFIPPKEKYKAFISDNRFKRLLPKMQFTNDINMADILILCPHYDSLKPKRYYMSGSFWYLPELKDAFTSERLYNKLGCHLNKVGNTKLPDVKLECITGETIHADVFSFEEIYLFDDVLEVVGGQIEPTIKDVISLAHMYSTNFNLAEDLCVNYKWTNYKMLIILYILAYATMDIEGYSHSKLVLLSKKIPLSEFPKLANINDAKDYLLNRLNITDEERNILKDEINQIYY